MILSKDIGKLLDVVMKAKLVLFILNVLSTNVRISPNLLEKGEKLRKLVRRPV